MNVGIGPIEEQRTSQRVLEAAAKAPAGFHGIEHLTLDHDGYLRWKGQTVERFDPEFAQSDAAKGKARICAAWCRHLEEVGEPVNKMTVVLKWGSEYSRVRGKKGSCDRHRLEWRRGMAARSCPGSRMPCLPCTAR
jgi:hypothetical protein